VDGPRGIVMTRYQAHRLCALCQAVIRCPRCGDMPKDLARPAGIERPDEDIPF
jgi:hypothetical protein